ncbi:MAG: GDP-fucose synthetase [Betaproteobacteria bacterium]|nr:GDP-fucose synthetase [Betaproteobacteria bacterium]
MSPESRIYVAGHAGLVGSAFVRTLQQQGYRNILTRTRAELDLTDQRAVGRFFDEASPEYVFLAAAKVGGIVANNSFPAEFIATNLAIQSNVISQARRCDVRRLLFLGSSCIYPRDCPQPIREEYLLTGPLEPTNRPYAIAKIAGVEMCWAYNRQYGTQYLAAMPTNLYGPGDNYDLQTSHVLPALIRKVHTAKVNRAPEVTLWGTGTPRREFLYTDDLAEAGVFLMNLPDAEFSTLAARPDGQAPLVNIGCGEDLTILELAELVREVVGYSGALVLDRSKPDGTPQKLLSIDRIAALGWRPRTSLKAGIALAYADYVGRTAAA